MRQIARWGLVLAVVAMASGGMAAIKKGAVDVEPSSVTSFTSATLLVTTNAKGAVSSMAIKTTSLRYNILTNGMSADTLKGFLKMNDKPVDVKGEVSLVDKVMCLKLVGPVKDMTPVLNGVQLSISMDPKDPEKITLTQIKTADGKYTYSVRYAEPWDKVDPDVLKKFLALRGKAVDIQGEISHSRQCVTITSIKESGSSKMKASSSKKKNK